MFSAFSFIKRRSVLLRVQHIYIEAHRFWRAVVADSQITRYPSIPKPGRRQWLGIEILW
jgi:hypothetical protein